MYNQVLIISPHPDDAVFSLGMHILHRFKYKLVWNIFSVQDYSVCNSGNPRIVILNEDEKASRRLKFKVLNEGYNEAHLRGYKNLSEILGHTDAKKKEPDIFEKLINKIDVLFRNEQFSSVYIPLGCGGHVDHILSRDTFLYWYENQYVNSNFRLFFYEDLPYGTNPVWFKRGLKILEKYNVRECFLRIENIDEKLEAISIYKSQIKQRDIQKIKEHSFEANHNCMVERVWEIEKHRKEYHFGLY